MISLVGVIVGVSVGEGTIVVEPGKISVLVTVGVDVGLEWPFPVLVFQLVETL